MIDIKNVQKHLAELQIDGWLIYDFHKSNQIAHELLQIPTSQVLTRRFFYWIPKSGTPVKIVHAIETYALDHLPGEKRVFLKWQSLDSLLKEILRGSSKIAMEYSPRCAVPYISKVDGGIIDLVRESNVKVVSSGALVQIFSCVLDEKQLTTHLYAADVLDKTASLVWQRLSENLKKGVATSEFDVQQWMLSEFEKAGCETNHPPTCAVNDHSAMPHYTPTKETAAYIKKGDFILIDLWCKQKKPGSIFADITRVAVASEKPTPKQQEIFSIVRQAQKAATDFIEKHYEKNIEIKGSEADAVARKVISDAGYEDFFTHRTGHNITSELHGPGAHLDSLETFDERPLIAGTCFSIEPGIYLPGEFGVRLEYDVFLAPNHKIMVTGGIQDDLVKLF